MGDGCWKHDDETLRQKLALDERHKDWLKDGSRLRLLICSNFMKGISCIWCEIVAQIVWLKCDKWW